MLVQQQESLPELLTYEEAARAMGITYSGINKAIMEGRLTSVKISGHRKKLIRREDVLNYGKVPVSDTQTNVSSLPPDLVQMLRDSIQSLDASIDTSIDKKIYGRAVLILTALRGIDSDPKALTLSAL